jgi:hypothetical protein
LILDARNNTAPARNRFVNPLQDGFPGTAVFRSVRYGLNHGWIYGQQGHDKNGQNEGKVTQRQFSQSAQISQLASSALDIRNTLYWAHMLGWSRSSMLLIGFLTLSAPKP